MEKMIEVALATVMCLLLCACSKVPANDNSDASVIAVEENKMTEEKAISAVKYQSKVFNKTDSDIADFFNYRNWAPPDYGTSSATENSNGTWSVVLTGSITGVVDINRGKETHSFWINATVDAYGNILEFTVQTYRDGARSAEEG